MPNPSKTNIQIALNDSFLPLAVEYNDAYTTTWTAPGLANDTEYYIRARHAFPDGALDVFGDFGNTNKFRTKGAKPSIAPTVTYPTNGATGISLKPTVTVTALDRGVYTNIEVAKDSNFSQIVQSYNSGYTESWSVPSSLTENTEYYVRVRHALGGYVWSDFGAANKFTTLTPKPAKPSVTAPANNAVNVAVTPTVTVTSSAAGTYTQIQIFADIACTNMVGSYNSTYTTSWTVPDGTLQEGFTYYIRVQHAKGDHIWSDWSNINKFTTKIEKPGKPYIVSPSNGATGVSRTPTVTTSEQADATSTQIHVASDVGFTNIVAKYEGNYATSLQITKTLAEVTSYYCRVRHAKGTNVWSDWSDISTFQTMATTPSKPSITSPSDGATRVAIRPTITVSDSNLATNTRIQVASSTNFMEGDIVQSYGNDGQSTYTTSWTLQANLEYKSQYYVRVQHGNDGSWSAWSDVVDFTTVGAQPSKPSVNIPANNATKVALTSTVEVSSATADHTTIVISSQSNFSNEVAKYDGTYTTTWVITSGALSEGTVYYIRVQHSNDGEASDWSDANQFTTYQSKPTAPSVTSPADNATNVPLSLTVYVSSLDGAQKTKIQISTDTAFNSVLMSYDGDYTTSWTVPQQLGQAQTYWVRVQHALADNNWSDWSSANKFTTEDPQPVGAPAILVPQNNDSGLGSVINVTVEYGVCSVAGKTRNGTTIEISEKSDFSIIKTFYASSYTEFWTASGLEMAKVYYIRAKHSYTDVGYGSFGPVSKFSTASSGATTPYVIDPYHGYMTEDLHVLSTVSDGEYAGGGHSWTGTHIQISNSPGFGSIQTEYNGTATNTWYSGELAYGTRYYIRVRHQFDGSEWSAWSSANLFGVAGDDFTVEYDNSLTTATLVKWMQGSMPNYETDFQYSLDLGETWQVGHWANDSWTVGLGKTRTLTLRGDFVCKNSDGSKNRLVFAFWSQLNVWKVRGKVINILGGQPLPPTNTLLRDIFWGASNLQEISTNMFVGIDGELEHDSLRALFMGCRKLKRIPPRLFGNITYSGTEPRSVFQDLFQYCSDLKGLSATRADGMRICDMPNVTGQAAYLGCDGLEDYDTIPPHWKG